MSAAVIATASQRRGKTSVRFSCGCNPVFELRQLNTLPSLVAWLANPDGSPAALTGATVTFAVRRESGATLFTRSVTVLDPTQAQVQVDWMPDNTLVAGIYRGTFEVDYGLGGTLSYPNAGWVTLLIHAVGGV